MGGIFSSSYVFWPWLLSVFSRPFLGMFIILWADFSQKLPRFSKEFTNFVKKDDQFSSGKNPDLEELVHVDKQLL